MYRHSKYYERTLVLLKPEVVQRSIMGEIITRFERKGLKIVAMKMVWPTEEQAAKHYDWSKEEKIITGNRTIDAYQEKGLEITKTATEYAEETQQKLRSHISAGPVVAMVIAGGHAVEHVRKIRGKANAVQADIGSITADYTIDSYAMADEVERAARSLVHASGSVDEAQREIAVWFNENEIFEYDLAHELIMYAKEWEKQNEQFDPNKHHTIS